MSEKVIENEKSIIIKIDESQYEHLMIAFGNIIRELNSIAFKVKELESGLTKIEAELRLMRIEGEEKK